MFTKKLLICLCAAFVVFSVAGCAVAQSHAEPNSSYEEVNTPLPIETLTNDAETRDHDDESNEDGPVGVEQPCESEFVSIDNQSTKAEQSNDNLNPEVNNSFSESPVPSEPQSAETNSNSSSNTSSEKPNVSVEDPSEPAVNIPVPPEADNPDNNLPSEESNDKEEVPVVCQHNWQSVYHAEVGHYSDSYIVCSCGSRFQSTGAWSAHVESFSGTESLFNHTSWGTARDYIVDSPEYTEWVCSKCGTATRTQP